MTSGRCGSAEGTEQINTTCSVSVLGLPGEARPDKTLPFRDLPRN
jgi:hypothetical protein